MILGGSFVWASIYFNYLESSRLNLVNQWSVKMSVSGEAVKCFMKLSGYFKGECSFVRTSSNWIHWKVCQRNIFKLNVEVFTQLALWKVSEAVHKFQDILIQWSNESLKASFKTIQSFERWFQRLCDIGFLRAFEFPSFS